MAQRVFPAVNEALPDVTAFVEEELEALDCPMKFIMQLNICVEEMFVNVAHYAYPGGEGSVELSLNCAGHEVSVTLRDKGIPFDPLAKDDPDVSLSADERKIGGLGIFMVKKTMDSVEYRREDGWNVFIMKKEF